MPDDSTVNTTLEAVEANHIHQQHEATDDSFGAPCLGCGLRNPSQRRSCLACGAPLGSHDDVAGPLPIDPPMLERHAESATLRAVVERFGQTRAGSIVTLVAPLGGGSTRLLRFAAEQLLAAGAVRVLTTTVRDADGPYAPITRLLWERFGVTPAKGPQTARGEINAEVNRVLASRSGPATEHARRIVVAAGLPADGTGRWESDVGRILPRVGDSVTRFLQADGAGTPIALLVDNLDAALDDGFALWEHVLRGLGRAPVLVIMAGRPGLVERLGPLAGTVIRPAPLSGVATRQLCEHLLPGLPSLPNDFVDAIVRRAEGAPGQLREILLALIESRVIVVDEAPWRVDLAALGADGPISAHDLHGYRLTQLGGEARSLLARAAIVGEVFWEGAVAAMTRMEEGAGDPHETDAVAYRVSETLRALVSAELIAPIEESELALERQFAFVVPGVRDSLLAEQDEAVQQRRHDVCAGWLELAAGPRADDLAHAIASHLERARLFDAAARAYLRAARAARLSYRGPLAVQLFNRALGLLPAGDAPTRIDALHDKGVVLSLIGRVDEATEVFREMLSTAHRFGARSKMAAALGRLGRLARGRGEITLARAYLAQALELFRLADDRRGVAAVQDDLGMLAYLSGDFETALAHSTHALDLRRELDDSLGEALSTHNLGLVHHARGQPRQARAHFERALTLREQHGDLEGTVTTRNVLAALAFDRGEYDQAVQIWNEILELSEALGDKRMIVYATHNLGESALRRGDPATAAQLLEAAEDLADEIGDKRATAEIERSRGMLFRTEQDLGRARLHLSRSLEIARAMGLREAEALALRGLGEVCATTMFDETGAIARDAERFFTDAIAILNELGATRELARTRAAYGEYLLEHGDVINGRTALTLAVPVLERLELIEAPRLRSTLKRHGGEMILPGQSLG